MSGVDVLKLLAYHAAGIESGSGHGDGLELPQDECQKVASELMLVHAAVAELIEAAEDISLYELDCPPSYFRRLDDALRRVKGESE